MTDMAGMLIRSGDIVLIGDELLIVTHVRHGAKAKAKAKAYFTGDPRLYLMRPWRRVEHTKSVREVLRLREEVSELQDEEEQRA